MTKPTLPSVLLFTAAMTSVLPAQGGGTPPANPAIAFAEAGIKVMNADGTNVRAVVTLRKGESARAPAWSADDSQLVFQGTFSGVFGIHRVNVDGTGRLRIANRHVFGSSPPPTFPDWSPVPTPDGTHRIVYGDESVPGMKDLYVVRPDGTGLLNLTNTPGRYEADASWSPDGTRLAVHVISGSAQGTDQILVCTVGLVNGQLAIVSETTVFTSAMFVNTPRWARGSDAIAFSDLAGLTTPMFAWVLDLAVGVPLRLTTATSGTERYASFRGDDQRLCFQRGNAGIHTIDSNRTGQVQIRSTGTDPNWRHTP